MIICDMIQGGPEWHAARYGVLTASRATALIAPGSEPRAPRCFALTDAGLVARLRGSVQLAAQAALAAPVLHGTKVLDEREIPGGISPTLKTMIERGYVVEVDAPPDAEPIAAPLAVSSQRDGLLARLLAEQITQSSAEEFRGSPWTEHGHACEPEAAAYVALQTGLEPRPTGLVYRDETRLTACSPDLLLLEDGEPVAGGEVKCPAAWTHIGYLRAGVVPREYQAQIQFSLWVTGLPLWYFASYAASPDDVPYLESWRPGATLPPMVLEVEPAPRFQDAFSQHVPPFIDELLAARAELLAMGAVPAPALTSGEVDPCTTS